MNNEILLFDNSVIASMEQPSPNQPQFSNNIRWTTVLPSSTKPPTHRNCDLRVCSPPATILRQQTPSIQQLPYLSRPLPAISTVRCVSKDGQIRHFFHRPSKAYTTGTRKRRKVHTDDDGGETRWHKTGKTRPVFLGGAVKGFKKILVLYTNYGRQRKPEKTNWVMHQYHLGNNEEEKDGELVVSKVFYQTQPRQCGSSVKDSLKKKSRTRIGHDDDSPIIKNTPYVEYYNNPPLISYDIGSQNRGSSPQLIPNLVLQGDGPSFIHLPTNSSKGKVLERA